MPEVEIVPQLRQYLRHASAMLDVRFYVDGLLADPGLTTLRVVSLDDTELVPAGSATVDAGTGARQFTLPAGATSQLDTLTTTWSTATYGDLVTTVEVVGAYLFTLRQARNFEYGALRDEMTYTNDDIDRMRAWLTDELQGICGQSMIPRATLETRSSRGLSVLGTTWAHVNSVRSISYRSASTADWVALTADELLAIQVVDAGIVANEALVAFTTGVQNYRLLYDHGYASPPGLMSDAALKLARARLVRSGVSDRAMSIASELGTEQLAIANETLDRHFGIPDVDAEIARWSVRWPAIA
jgi:hypothetical protein